MNELEMLEVLDNCITKIETTKRGDELLALLEIKYRLNRAKKEIGDNIDRRLESTFKEAV